jgi:hypothetical protein
MSSTKVGVLISVVAGNRKWLRHSSRLQGLEVLGAARKHYSRIHLGRLRTSGPRHGGRGRGSGLTIEVGVSDGLRLTQAESFGGFPTARFPMSSPGAVTESVAAHRSGRLQPLFPIPVTGSRGGSSPFRCS